MRQFVKTGVLAGGTAALVVSGTLVSYASWTLPGPAATARVAAGAMPDGVTPQAQAFRDEVVVTWSAQEIVPGVKMTAYVVTAHDTDRTPLPPIARTVGRSSSAIESVTFTAAELAGGKWKWAITPRLASWTGAEGPLSHPGLVFRTAGAAVTKAATGRSSEEAGPATSIPAHPTATSGAEEPAKKPSAGPTQEPVEAVTPVESQGPESQGPESQGPEGQGAESPSAIDSPPAL